MRRRDLEHAIRAASEISQQGRILIIGSQSILGTFTEDQLPAAASMSVELDVARIEVPNPQELSDEISFAVGEMSQFHETHGFYLEGVGVETAALPRNWEYRLVRVESQGATGFCLDPYDLCVAKLIAHREKDYAFVRSLIEFGLIKIDQLRARLIEVDEETLDAYEDPKYVRYGFQTADAWLAAL